MRMPIYDDFTLQTPVVYSTVIWDGMNQVGTSVRMIMPAISVQNKIRDGALNLNDLFHILRHWFASVQQDQDPKEYLALNQGSSRLNQIINNDDMTTSRTSFLDPHYPFVVFTNFCTDDLTLVEISLEQKYTKKQHAVLLR